MRRMAAALALVPAIALVGACGLIPPGKGPVEAAPLALACRPVSGVLGGPEDVVIGADGIAFVSSTDRRQLLGHEVASREAHVGWIYRVDLNEPEPRGVDVTPPELRNEVFQPHGMSEVVLPSGERLIFVINHQPAWKPATWYRRGRWDTCDGTDRIDILRVGSDHQLDRIDSVTAEEARLISPNDIAAVGRRAFYVTNDHGTRSCMTQRLRDLAGWNNGNLTYFDGVEAQVVADLPWANGVAVSDRGEGRRRVYASSGNEGTIVEFEWDEAHPARPTRRQPVRLGSLADNIEVDAEGTILIAAHPDLLGFVANGLGWFGIRTSPSEVLRVEWPDRRDARTTRIWADDGKDVPASSVAAAHPRSHANPSRLLVGTVFGPLALCERK